MKKYKVYGAIVSIFIVFFFSACSEEKKEENADIIYGDYKIEVESNEYYPNTYTGKIVLSIENTKSGLEKLLYTSDDLVRDGHKYLIGDEHCLNVQQKEEDIICHTYEESYESKTQVIVIEYIDYTSSHSGEPLNIQIKGSNNNVEKEIYCPMTVEEEVIEFSDLQNNQKIVVSPKGFLVEGVTEEVTSFVVTYEDDSEEIFIDSESQVYKPSAAVVEGAFYQEIPKWDEIKEIECNGMCFVRK